MGLDLTGRRVLVTGASAGIGPAITRAAHGRGPTVVLTARRQELLEQLATELGSRVETLPADLADRAAVSSLLEQAGQVDVLIANAGLPATGPLDGFSADRVDKVLEATIAHEYIADPYRELVALNQDDERARELVGASAAVVLTRMPDLTRELRRQGRNWDEQQLLDPPRAQRTLHAIATGLAQVERELSALRALHDDIAAELRQRIDGIRRS